MIYQSCYYIIEQMSLKFESLKRNRRFILLMMAVIVPGLIISALGLFYVSQQRKARDFNLREKYAAALGLIRDEIERQIETAVDNTFKQVAIPATPAPTHAVINQENVQAFMKAILLENPVVKYPFLINNDGSYIFPLSRKATFSKGNVITPGETLFNTTIKHMGKNGKNSTFYRLFKQAENLELKEKNCPGAIDIYRQLLAQVKQTQTGLYIGHAIARCYYKLNKFPQAAAYLSDILRQPPGVLEKDTAFYSLVLYLAARVYRQMDLQTEAMEYYLPLYDLTLRFEYDITVNKEAFAYFKNEALDYLLRHMDKDGKSNQPGFDRVKAREGIERLSPLDIDLRWKYFDVEENGLEKNGQGENASAFQKMRELYLPTDDKTLFYKEVKELKLGSGTDKFPLKIRPDIVYTRVANPSPKNSPSPALIFGFMISPDFVVSQVLPPIIKKFLEDEPLLVTIKEKNKNNLAGAANTTAKTFVLMGLPFKHFYPSSELVLSSFREGYIESLVKKEMWLNYSLMAAIISLLLLGVWFFYKYTTREVELIRLKSDFVDSASHTLKTPLTRIRMMAEKMELGWLKDETKKKEYFRAILSETDRMTEMVTNMLDFSRVEAGKMHFEMKKGNLRHQVQHVMASLQSHIESLGFQLEMNLAEDIPLFYFDPEAIKSILVNLVHNALKYAKEGKYIGIALYRDGDRAVMAVQDKGPGIPANEREKIFEKFYRGRCETVKAMEGSGLGLFLVRHAVKAHKGNIEVNGGPGQGSTFIIHLPLKN